MGVFCQDQEEEDQGVASGHCPSTKEAEYRHDQVFIAVHGVRAALPLQRCGGEGIQRHVQAGLEGSPRPPWRHLYLLRPQKETVDVVPGAAGIQRQLVKLHSFSDVVLQLLALAQGFPVWPWEVVHDVGEGVVDLQEKETQEGSGA